MPTDLTGTPTSLGIGTYNVDADAPSGLGFNAAMAQIDALIQARVAKPSGIASGEVPVWNGTGWDRSSVTKLNPSNIANGIAASQLSGYPADATKVLKGDGSWGAAAGAMTLIDDYTVSGAVLATYDTNTRLGGNIPQTYKDLILAVTSKSDQAATQDIRCRVNNAAASYDWQDTYAAAGTTTSSEGLSDTSLRVGWTARSGSGIFSSMEILLANYVNIGLPVVQSSYMAFTDTGTGNHRRGGAGGLYAAVAAATTRIQLFLATGNFQIGTRFTLYGRG